MENLNNVPSTGTFGGSVSKINSNFDLVVNAINSLEYQTTRSKGILNYGQNPATVFPNAVAGDWCMILSQGNVFPATIKTYNGSTWSGSGTWNPEGVDLTQYAQKSEMTTAIANSLAQATARMGYGECTVNGTSLSVSIPNFILPTSGGTIHIKMSAVGTGASTLSINGTTAKTLWYNGKAVSSTNTWEANEIISVFYDGTRFMASNSQGGGGKAEKIKYDNSQSGLASNNVQGAVDEVAVKANIFGTISRDADFGIADDGGNLLAEFANGHFKTKNFDSALVPSYGTRGSELDFAITDEVGQDIVQFLNGHIKTKNFYSADIAGLFNIRGKKISIIGDSISTFTGYIPSGYTSFYTSSHPSVNTVEKTWWYQVINKLGLVLGINASWSGCKLTLGENANSTTNAYVACSPKRIEDIGANGTPDIIICFVGTNDFGYNAVIGDYDARSAIPELSSAVSTTTPQNEFADAYAVMINRIRTAYPTAKLFCCTILDRASIFPPTNNVPATMSDYNRKIIELCNNMGVKVIRTHECGISVWNTGTYLQDGLHPKSNGMELISNCVVKELIKNF